MLTKVFGSAYLAAGTQVLLGDGTSKAIEDVVVGDQVLAADPATGETVAKPVVDIYLHHDVDTYLVETGSGTVTSAAEYPFWVDGRGWTPVRELQTGDKLVDADGVRVELVSVTATGVSATVHNDCSYSPPYSELKNAELKDAHHIIQDAAVQDLPVYSHRGAPAIQLDGPSQSIGSPLYHATQVQRSLPLGGTYGDERQIARAILQAAGKSEPEIGDAMIRADRYFMDELGLTHNSPTTISADYLKPSVTDAA